MNLIRKHVNTENRKIFTFIFCIKVTCIENDVQ